MTDTTRELQPELEGPTDEEILNLSLEHGISYSLIDGSVMRDDALSFARAVLSRWGRPEPEGPTVMEIIELADEIEAEELGQVDLVRRALARWGRPAIQPEPEYPSGKELLELMPEIVRDEFSYAAKICSDATGGQVKPRIFRVALNTAALQYARAVLAHYTS